MLSEAEHQYTSTINAPSPTLCSSLCTLEPPRPFPLTQPTSPHQSVLQTNSSASLKLKPYPAVLLSAFHVDHTCSQSSLVPLRLHQARRQQNVGKQSLQENQIPLMHRGDGNAGEHSSCTVEVTKVCCIMSKVIRNKASKTACMNKNYSLFSVMQNGPW